MVVGDLDQYEHSEQPMTFIYKGSIKDCTGKDNDRAFKDKDLKSVLNESFRTRINITGDCILLRLQ